MQVSYNDLLYPGEVVAIYMYEVLGQPLLRGFHSREVVEDYFLLIPGVSGIEYDS